MRDRYGPGPSARTAIGSAAVPACGQIGHGRALLDQVGREGVRRANGFLEDKVDGGRGPARDAEGGMGRGEVGGLRLRAGTGASMRGAAGLGGVGEAYEALRWLLLHRVVGRGREPGTWILEIGRAP